MLGCRGPLRVVKVSDWRSEAETLETGGPRSRVVLCNLREKEEGEQEEEEEEELEE